MECKGRDQKPLALNGFCVMYPQPVPLQVAVKGRGKMSILHRAFRRHPNLFVITLGIAIEVAIVAIVWWVIMETP
jgi:hypothetical protein